MTRLFLTLILAVGTPMARAADRVPAVPGAEGAVKPARDAVDERIIAGVRDGTGRRCLSAAADAWPVLATTEPPADTDHDGLPDAWEQSQGHNPADATDAAEPSDSGWANLEVWMNSL